MKGYSNETGQPHVPPQKKERKKKAVSEKRYSRSFTFSAETIDFLEKKEAELGKGKISRFVEEIILANRG